MIVRVENVCPLHLKSLYRPRAQLFCLFSDKIYLLRNSKRARKELSINVDYIDVINGVSTLKRNQRYFYQIQLQMLVSGRSYCDFFVWSPQNFICIRVAFDQVFCLAELDKATSFHSKCILPEILCRYFTVGISHESVPDTVCTNTDMFGNVTVASEETVQTQVVKSEKPRITKKTLYCTCRGKDDGSEMICCDNDKCEIGWYHFRCINMTHAPIDKWFCENCR